MGGQVDVVFANGRIEVSWSPATETATPSAKAMAAITPLLKQRRYGEARPLLEALLKAEPENRDALYNLGMVASDEGQLKEARELLRRSVAVDPSFSNAQVALGVAALRDQDQAEARQALERAIELEPGNPYALRTLGSLLTTAGALAAGQNGSGRPWRWHRTMLWPACAWPKRCWSWIQMSTATRPISCCCG
ncbi:MAG: tetratricopeptide repeat protein [Cyanobium sp. ELA712]